MTKTLLRPYRNAGQPRAMNSIEVPAGPIIRALDEYLERAGVADGVDRYDPACYTRTDLALRIWPECAPNDASRRLAHLRRRRFLRFVLADRILCAINRVELWYADPELAPRYQEVRL